MLARAGVKLDRISVVAVHGPGLRSSEQWSPSSASPSTRRIDPTTNKVYVASIEDTSISVINGATCNGSDHTGCSQTPAKIAVGNYPCAIAADPAARTAYITNGDNTVSVIRLTHRAG